MTECDCPGRLEYFVRYGILSFKWSRDVLRRILIHPKWIESDPCDLVFWIELRVKCFIFSLNLAEGRQMPTQGAYDDIIDKKVALTGGAISVNLIGQIRPGRCGVHAFNQLAKVFPQTLQSFATVTADTIRSDLKTPIPPPQGA